MVVKSHKMFRGANGELHDTADDDDPDSPECQFAADMTAHYEELGKHFPHHPRNTHHEGHSHRADSAVVYIWDNISLELSVAIP